MITTDEYPDDPADPHHSTAWVSCRVISKPLDQFEQELFAMAVAVSDWPGRSAGCSEAEALEWHLVDSARWLHAVGDACRACRHWSTRLRATA